MRSRLQPCQCCRRAFDHGFVVALVQSAKRGGLAGVLKQRPCFLHCLCLGILFVFTFVLNTVAELVRQRLRRRYAQL